MIETPQIVNTADQLTAYIHLTIPRNEIQNVMGPGIGEIMATLEKQGVVATGPWFSHHLKIDPGIFDFEICFPVKELFTPEGRVTNGHLPSVKAARTIYHGPYEGLGEAWSEFDTWIVSQGLTPAESLLETYLTDPFPNPDPSTYRTELTRPLL